MEFGFVILLVFGIICIIVCMIRDMKHGDREAIFHREQSKIIIQKECADHIEIIADASDFPTKSDDAGNNHYFYETKIGYPFTHVGDYFHMGDKVAYIEILREKVWTSPSTKPVHKKDTIRKIEILAPSDGYVWYDVNQYYCNNLTTICEWYEDLPALVSAHYKNTFSIVTDEKSHKVFVWDNPSFVFLFGLGIEVEVNKNKPILKFSRQYLSIEFNFDDETTLLIHPENYRHWLSKSEYDVLYSKKIKEVVCYTIEENEERYEKKNNNQVGYYVLLDKLGCLHEASRSIDFKWNPQVKEPDYKAHRDFYELICNLTERFIHLRDKLSNNLPVFTAFQKRYPETYRALDDCFNFYICVDAYRCYKGMGESMEMESICGQGLGLLIMHMISDKYSPSYLSFVRLRQMKRQLRNFMVTVEDQSSKIAKDDLFVMAPIFKDCDPELYRKYMDLLYEWSYTVATYDKYMSDTEKNFLERLKNGTEPKTNEEKPTKVIATDLDVDDVCRELNGLIGLDSVKDEVSSLVNFIKIQKSREEQGLKTSQLSYHCVFTGNPGTGKTTVARILADIYRKLGILKTGQLIETDRSGLVAEYVGQTAVKTNAVIDKALNGVLFIDEAYSLAEGGANDYGNEAITTLLKRMEDERKRLVVILAGYNENMRAFISSNPGLQSRFNRYICFSDYSAEELQQIFTSMARSNEYVLDHSARDKLKDVITTELNKKDPFFGNGRFVRNIFEKTIQKQADRLSHNGHPSKEELQMITDKDITVD